LERKLTGTLFFQDDDELLEKYGETISVNHRNALIVRIGEKYILRQAIERLQKTNADILKGGEKTKRKRDPFASEVRQNGKKSKR